jgi:hypothetical protein
VKFSEFLLPQLRECFPSRNLQERNVQEPGEGPFALFPAIHPDVGNLELYDEGEEITFVVGNFTHIHFACYEAHLSPEAKAAQISADVVAFLDAIFSEQLEFWGSHSGAGGTRPRDSQGRLSRFVFGRRAFVWSGPVSEDGG